MESIVVKPQVLEMSQKLDTSSIELPVILKDKILLSPGIWNGLNFTKEELSKALKNTDWDNKENYALIYEHEQKASNWLGWVKNVNMSEEGVVKGDLEIWDIDLARKLMLAKAKLGISARVISKVGEDEDGNFVDFTFNNFSVVYDPACKNAYINLSQNKLLEKIDELAQRVKELEDGITSSSSVEGKEVGNAKTNQPIKYEDKKKKKKKEEMSDFIEVKRRENLTEKMENEETKKDEQVSEEEKVEESKEDAKEEVESKEEEKSESEDKAESEEESKEEDAEDSEEMSSKLDLVLSELKKISDRVANLESKKTVKNSETKELSQEKDANSVSKKAMNLTEVPKGYTQGDHEYAIRLLSQVGQR